MRNHNDLSGSAKQSFRRTPLQRKVDRYLVGMDRVHKKITASPDGYRKFLQRAGILDEQGNLTEHYK